MAKSRFPSPPPEDPAEDLFDVAAAWWVRRLEDGWTPGQEAEFQAWLAVDPAHGQTYEAVLEAMSAFNDAAPGMADRGPVPTFEPPPAARPSRRAWIAGGGAALAAGLAGWAILTRSEPARLYVAPATSPAAFTLADGSRLFVDVGGQVSVRIGRGARRLELVRGQARFDVAHDPTRPFSVAVGDQVVVATGTAFNIERLSDRAIVSLLEGRVLIHPVDRADQGLPLRAGERAVLTPGVAPRRTPGDVAAASSWREGRLVFDDTPLAEAVERVSRYGPRVRLADASLASLHVTGVFRTGDTAAFVEAITAYLPVAARRDPDGAAALVRRSGKD
ncbi:MAG: FecR domain-containing protein [Caulobacter sp.]|nr:FecR domain-containing protein [Caulobacter sp.]